MLDLQNNPLISVVIPAYKVEQYLEKCLDSVRNQTYQNLEVIVVEDGSPDRCGQIADEYAKKDARIKVIHKQNGGLSDARNHGLDCITGEYVAFIDSDDYIAKDYMERLYCAMEKRKASIAICEIQAVDETGNKLTLAESFPPIECETVLSGKEVLTCGMKGKWEYVTAWGKLYDARIFKTLRFPLKRLYEDEYVFCDIFLGQETVVCIPDQSYYYLQRTQSIMGSGYSQKACQDYLDMWEERLAKLDSAKEIALGTITRQAYVAWIVLYLARYANDMDVEHMKKLKQDLKRYLSCVFLRPYLNGKTANMKLAIKGFITIINEKALSKRYQ